MTAQTLYPILYLEINLTAALLILFIRFKTLGISKMVSQRNLSSAIDAEIVFFLSDTAAALKRTPCPSTGSLPIRISPCRPSP